MSRPPSPPPRRLPAYMLYGESGSALVAERLHIETIQARSRLHDWEIRPHRHEAMCQFLHLAQGRAQTWLDGGMLALQGPCLVRVPPLVAHGFRFEPGVHGHVLTVLQTHLDAVLDRLLPGEPRLRRWLQSAGALELAEGEDQAPALAAAVATLAAEHAGHRPHRAAALDLALQGLLLALLRTLPASAPAGAPEADGRVPQGARPARAEEHLRRYRALVEAQFRSQPRVADLAAQLGITPTQLNRICRAWLGRSALDLLHDRLALEAQRQLVYTTLSVKEIGLDLGFADPGYFNRFFLRVCGLTPGQWRRQREPAMA